MLITRANPRAARLIAAAVHLGLSLLVAGLAAGLVFGVWYPYPYREISGGRELFLLVVAVDVVMGPLLTLAIFNTAKPSKMLGLDLAVIGLLQLAALGYGLWTVSMARPVHLVFEIDRFRVVHAVDVPPELLKLAPPGLQQLPLAGPTVISIRKFRDANESFDATMAAIQGASLGARPDLWRPYDQVVADVIARARPLDELRTRFPAGADAINTALKSPSVDRTPVAALGYVPMVGRQAFWTVIVDTRNAGVLAFVPLDSF